MMTNKKLLRFNVNTSSSSSSSSSTLLLQVCKMLVVGVALLLLLMSQHPVTATTSMMDDEDDEKASLLSSSQQKLLIRAGTETTTTTSLASAPAANGGRQHRRELLFSGFLDGIFGIIERLWGRIFGLFQDDNCPPDGFDALNPFDLDEYIRARWYVQRQIPVSYQQFPEDFFCVTAKYIKDDSFCLFCNNKPRVIIDNGNRRGGVNGTFGGGSPSRFFRGIIRNPDSHPARVSVGFLADLLAWRSNYWIVAAGTYDEARDFNATPANGTYEYAIIVGGPPSKETDNGKCVPQPDLLDLLGMWIFTRDQFPGDDVITAIYQIANNLGLDATVWLNVTQEGCDYTGID